ncbi:DUF7524 family protein [Halodesulfurarchaeum sp.]|uniref:DUF7524 family protein n=1 Tax=Halodesulfurarchaeum sp. TaxID=1980530 RepID=UPI001BBB86ED|nr:hypothetical protein [Halodesulfurarchaeum sp.]
MPGLTVYLNREGLNTVETDKTAVNATRSVDIVLENHGKPTHVHLHMNDDLAMMGSIEEPNQFVPKGEWREVELQLTEAAQGSGRLEITVGYGQERESVEIEVEPPEDTEETSNAGPDKIDTVGENAGSSEQGEAASWVSEQLGDVIDTERLRNPLVLGTGVAFLVVLLVLLVVDPFAAVAAALGALLVGITVLSYVRADDLSESSEED